MSSGATPPATSSAARTSLPMSGRTPPPWPRTGGRTRNRWPRRSAHPPRGPPPTTAPHRIHDWSVLASEDTEGFRARWTDIQTGFVDAPRRAVEQADALVAELVRHLARTFADERERLERHWDQGDDVPTDNLRDAFQRYRSFFERLLAT